jgi:hypothetical protein
VRRISPNSGRERLSRRAVDGTRRFVLLGQVWQTVFASWLVSAGVLRQPPVKRVLHAVTGCALVGFPPPAKPRQNGHVTGVNEVPLMMLQRNAADLLMPTQQRRDDTVRPAKGHYWWSMCSRT